MPFEPPTPKELRDALDALGEVAALVERDLTDQSTGWFYDFKSKIEKARLAVRRFDECGPEIGPVYVYVQGGTVQGASGPRGVSFVLLDKDNADADPETAETMAQDERQRDADTEAGRVVPIF